MLVKSSSTTFTQSNTYIFDVSLIVGGAINIIEFKFSD